jgi:hypothetical protein
MIVMFLYEVTNQGFLAEYWSILTDPAHVAVELTLMLVIDVMLLGLIWPAIRSYVNRKLAVQHEVFDAEHGIHHHEDHVHLDPDVVHSHDEHPHD